ncbi:MAG: glycoside hydrolase family 9 protein [Pleurocapsa minor HA4230-MV1]|nr:glycoside hydrolase family 9 protein [Pleurocapsa minor HA4230-MV1]
MIQEKSLGGANLSAAPSIVEDWQGGYKLELELKAESQADDWQVNFNLPYKITAAYGVDLIDNGNGSYTITGQNDQIDLTSGQSIKPIFIIDDGGQQALNPEFSGAAGEDIPEVPTPVTSPTSPNTPVDIPDSPEQSVGQQGKFAYGEALQKSLLFFEANRSGPLPADNRLEWRSDSTTSDGKDVGRDLVGGYFDAGDHIKFIQPMAFSMAMLAWSGVDYRETYQKAGQFDDLLQAVKWGTDYFLKCNETNGSSTTRFWVQVGDANDHNFWVPPEQIDQKTARPSFAVDANKPGSDAAAGTASALASASILFAGVDEAYSAKLLENAVQLFDFAEKYQGKYSDSVSAANPFYTSWSGYKDELVLGAVWLYRATGDKAYLSKAENYYRDGIGHIGSWTYAADDHSYAAMALLALESSDNFFKEEFKTWAQNWLNGSGGVQHTEGGFAVRAEWASAPLDMSAAYLLEWYDDFVEPNQEYSTFAQKQVDYVLGDNPLNYSYVVGFGENYPVRAHHRGSAGTAPLDGSDRPNDNLLVGALVGGPRNTDNSHQDKRDDWVTNEVGTGYNAPFAAAAVQQYEKFGGDPLPDGDLSSIPGVK